MTPMERTHREPSHARTYLMCPPDYFAVEYAINPWMNTGEPVDLALARRQWEQLKATYVNLGHIVHTIGAMPGLPDMVFAANGATVIAGTVLGARFKHPERYPEGAAYMDWFRRNGYRVVEPEHVNEGEGDIMFAGQTIIAGYGFRTELAACTQAEAVFGLPTISLRLTDPRFYHLDTALIRLNENTAAYYPPAFDEAGQAALAGHFDVLIEAKAADAEALGLNGLSDGHNVVMPMQAEELAHEISAAGFNVLPVDMSEFKKAGGGPKCCTLEVREAGGTGGQSTDR
jgi:N-dimethylarginine dimethylaminohydrolase